MQRFYSFLTSALITFTIGLGVFWAYGQVVQAVDYATSVSENVVESVNIPTVIEHNQPKEKTVFDACTLRQKNRR